VRESASQQCERVCEQVLGSESEFERVTANASECERVRCIVYRTVSKIALCICHIFAFDTRVPLFNARVWSQLREYRQELYVIRNYGLWATFFGCDSMGLVSGILTQ